MYTYGQHLSLHAVLPIKPRLGGPVGRIDQHRHSIDKVEATANDEAHARRFGRLMGAHDTGQRVAVDDGERLDAEHGCGGEQLIASARAPQEAEMRSEEHTSELQSLMRNSYAVFCLKKKNQQSFSI